MNTLLWILGSTLLVSLLSLIGVFTFSFNQKIVKKMLLVLVGFSAGTLMGGAFLHLIPESMENAEPTTVYIFLLAGFSMFFLIERFLHWRHCHDGKCDIHNFTYMSMIGDSIHNFIDGLIISISFMVSIPFGVVTTISISVHEIPQEIGDFGVLLHGGYNKSKALLFNFLTGMTAMLGALVGYFMYDASTKIIPYILPIAAGGFIYIAASDLVPELHKDPDIKKAAWSFGLFILGIYSIWAIKFMFGG